MLSRMIAGPITLFLWAILLIVAAIFLAVFSPVPHRLQWISKGLAVAVLTYGVILMIGAAKGNSDPFNPWAQFEGNPLSVNAKSNFKIIRSMKDLQQQLSVAKNNHQWVLLDFYADWCSACVMMDRTVFSREDVQTRLKNIRLLRADVTKNNAFDQALLKRFQLVGPPGIIFFNAEGQELTSRRIVGEVSADEFLAQLTKRE